MYGSTLSPLPCLPVNSQLTSYITAHLHTHQQQPTCTQRRCPTLCLLGAIMSPRDLSSSTVFPATCLRCFLSLPLHNSLLKIRIPSQTMWYLYGSYRVFDRGRYMCTPAWSALGLRREQHATPATFRDTLLLPLRLPENVDLLINVNDWNCVPSNPPALSSHGVHIDKKASSRMGCRNDNPLQSSTTTNENAHHQRH